MTYKFTESAEKVIEYANKVTLELGHDYIGTEHILYGLVKESSGIASKVLEAQNITEERILAQIEDIIGPRKAQIKKDFRLYPTNKEGLRECVRRSKKVKFRLYWNRTSPYWNFKGRR